MSGSNRYSPELRERAVSMVNDNRQDYSSEWTALGANNNCLSQTRSRSGAQLPLPETLPEMFQTRADLSVRNSLGKILAKPERAGQSVWKTPSDLLFCLSGRRDSNPRPSPWQGERNSCEKFPVSRNGVTAFIAAGVEFDRDLGSVTLRDCVRGRGQDECGHWPPR
jgi:hypothetical protein